MLGTIRTLDADMKTLVHKRLRAIVQGIAEVNNAEVVLEIGEGYPITYNDLDLYNQMLPTLQRVTGVGSVNIIPAITEAEDFSFFQKKVLGIYFFRFYWQPYGYRLSFPQ